ncbi:hypothetical protein ACQY0O_000248 [Thecaphora frezii]
MAAFAYSFQPSSTAPLVGGSPFGRIAASPFRFVRQTYATNEPEADADDADDTNVNPRSPRARNSALKSKWKSFVHFFALPIRQYYQQPPGLSYRQRQPSREPRRRGSLVLDSDDHDSFSVWACPTYNCEVGDDEMVLFKSAEARQEAHDAIASTLHVQPPVTSSLLIQPGLRPERQSSEIQSDLGLIETFEQQAPTETRAEGEGNAEQGVGPGTPPTILIEEAAPDYELVGFTMSDVPAPTAATSSSPTPVLEVNESPGSPLVSPQARPRAFHRSLSNLGVLGGACPRVRSSLRPAFLRRSSQHTAALAATVHGNPASVQTPSSSRVASEPLATALLRSQYPLPKRGLTAQQLSFLSSVESLGRYGLATPLEGLSRVATPQGAGTPCSVPHLDVPPVDYFGPPMTSSMTR